MAERIAVSEAHRAGMLSLLPSDYRIEREGDAVLLLKADGSALAAFRVESVPPAEAAKSAEEDRGRSLGNPARGTARPNATEALPGR